MGIIQDLTALSLREKGIAGLSAAMPAISKRWCDAAGADITAALQLNAGTHRLSTQGATVWLAPLPARVQLVNATTPIDVSLFLPDGSAVSGPGLLCTLFPQAYLRLARLAAKHFENENAHNPQRPQGIPLHPVPHSYFVRPAALPADARGGMIRAGQSLVMGGALDFFDAGGNWIHPLMVASMLSRLVTQYPALDVDSAANNQFASLIGLTAEGRRIRLVQPNGRPYTGGRFEGITQVDAATQLYTVDAYTGTDTAIIGEVRRAADTGNAGDFPAETANRLLIQHAAYGRMGGTLSFPKMPDATALQQDFYTLIVTELNRSLLGERNVAFNGVSLGPAPVVRIHEHLRLLPHGNAVLSGLAAIQDGTTAESLLVASSQKYRFPLPTADFSPATWPAFPALGAVTADIIEFPTGLAQQIQDSSVAKFVAPASGAPSDVELRLKGLPKGAAVRVYHRVFLPEAVLKRGDGAGGVVVSEDASLTTTFKGTLNLILINPLGIIRPDGTGNTVPTDPKVIVDMVIVLRNGKKRMLGILEWPVGAAEAPVSSTVPENGLQNFLKRGVCNAGILGNTAPPLANAWPITSQAQFLNVLMQLTGEPTPPGQPFRDASRLPSMARRELLAASRTGSDWKALLSGGPLNPGLHSANAMVGAPGGLGGKEHTLTGVYAEHNRLAYDLARAAFRRTTYFANRLQALWSTDWNEPAVSAPLGETDSPSGGRGTVFGAVLQTIAPFAESPELALLKSVVDANVASIPTTWDALVDQVVVWINAITEPLGNNLQTQVANQLNSLKDNQPGNESRQERLYTELLRELVSACYGRRDALWAMREGIRQAKHFIYLETPGFSFTKRTETETYSVDLIDALRTRMTEVPGLKVIIGMPKRPDYFTPGYDQWVSREVEQRFLIMQALPARQVVFFHPVGFPGRPSNIETTTMIVDDRWALIGASAFRRRGLTFDGSSDLVFIDGEQALGAAPSLTGLRVQLLKQHLGLESADANPSSLAQLGDARTAFHLVRETLIAGGMGRIERLWNGREEHLPYAAPTVDIDLSNPEGITFNALAASVVSAFTSPLTGQ
jgi:hypothetical protein